MAKIRVAVVGLGFGAEFLPIYQRHPDAELYAICQRSADKLKEVGDQFGVERRYESYERLLADPNVDAVHINTPIAAHAPMSLAGRLLGFPRAEALVFLPLSYVARFVGRSGQDAAMMALFGTERWREAIPLQGLERREFLLGLFEDQLRAQSGIQYVRSFQLRTQDGNDYRLVFATGNKKGLALIKTAMWRVDPVGGTSYVAITESGQEVLFTPEASVDTSPLLRELRRRFGTEPFTIGEAEDFTLFDTPFRHDGHLKRLTLALAERAGQLEPVDPKSGRKPRSYPPGTRMRFTS
jgi:hypothetical protein